MRLVFKLLSPGRLLFVATVIVVGYLTLSAGHNVIQSYRLASDESQMRDQVQKLQEQKDQLEQIRDYLRTDEYVEFMARRVFGLVKPGETLVIVDAPDPPPAPEPDPDATWWQRLFSR